MLTAWTNLLLAWLLGLWPYDQLSQLWFGMCAFAIVFLIVAVWRDAADCKERPSRRLRDDTHHHATLMGEQQSAA